MRGSLALVGSGEYLPAMAEFEKSLIEDGEANGHRPRYIQIPTAAGQESIERIEFWKELGATQAERLDAEQVFLPIYSREDAFNPEFVEEIAGSALVYMSGGDPHHLSQTLIDTPVWQAILKNWDAGGSLAGCSAGAMVMSSHIPNFRFTKKPPTQGLEIIDGIRVIPHFNKFFKWIPDSAAKVLLHAPDGTILLGIDELTALVRRTGTTSWKVQGEQLVHIVSGLPQAQFKDGDELTLSL
jgi:cyanophycinase-like exopeptidase